MPEPTSNLSLDKPVYAMLKTITPYMCFIEPNYITILNGLLSVYIIYNVASNNTTFLLPLFILRVVLDMLDGCVARSCNKQTQFGGWLDCFIDDLFYPALIYTTLYSRNRIETYYTLIATCILYFYKANKTLNTFLHDNTILLPFLYYYLLCAAF